MRTIVYNAEAALKRYKEPPLELLIYTAANILQLEDQKILSQMPDLLNLLAQIELYRQRINNEIRKALTLNDFYSGQDSDIELLTVEEVTKLNGFLYPPEKEKKVQESFETIMQFCIRLHILHLWGFTSESYLLTKWMRIYFQPRYSSNERPQVFHKVLPEKAFLEASDECMRFLVGAKDWYEQYKNILPDDPHLEIAQEEYDELVDNLIESSKDKILGGVEHYMRRATRALDAMDYLNEVFSPPDQQ
ncbi:hypothetical protein OF83DRAFT_437801 [Amylostereum chailletii]|nr:hypothetical protein OF83DRAFT_437801 [Amylostereum chailletii]